MTEITHQTLQMVSHFICNAMNINMLDDDIVLYIGSDEAGSNLQAIIEWIEGQEDIPDGSRMEMALELRDRLADLLFEFETAIRVWR
jgi:hypothetical protein